MRSLKGSWKQWKNTVVGNAAVEEVIGCTNQSKSIHLLQILKNGWYHGMTSNLLAAIPPLANVSCPCLAVNAEFPESRIISEQTILPVSDSASTVLSNKKPPLTESPVIVALEEVILFVLPEESSAQVSSGKPFPLSLDALHWIQEWAL